MDSQNNIDKSILDLSVERSDFTVLLEESRKNEELTDVQLKIEDELFPAHRIILSLYSPVWKAMFSDQWSTSKICPISDQYVDPSIVEPLLHFLYTGSIQLTPDNVHPVCVAAHFLQIATLLQPTVKHLSRLVSVENVLSLFEFSVTCELKLLHFGCLRFITKNHERIFRDPQILNFPSRIFKDFISDLKEQNRPGTMLKVNTFDCIVRWTEVNPSERLDELPGLLKNVPLEDLPLKFLTGTVSEHPLVKESISCSQAVSAVLAKTGSERGDNLVFLNRDDWKAVCYDSDTKTWSKLPDMLNPKPLHDATVVNRKDIVVYVKTLGYKDFSDDPLEMFDWTLQTWKQLPKLPFQTNSFYVSMASLDGRLYVIGKSWEKRNEIVCFSFETQKWQFVKPIKNQICYAKLIEYDGYLYVFGRKLIERYDPLFDEWTCIDDPPGYLYYEASRQMTVHENKMFDCESNYLTEFDPETNHWTLHGDSCPAGSMVSANGKLLLAEDDTKWIHEYSFADKK